RVEVGALPVRKVAIAGIILVDAFVVALPLQPSCSCHCRGILELRLRRLHPQAKHLQLRHERWSRCRLDLPVLVSLHLSGAVAATAGAHALGAATRAARRPHPSSAGGTRRIVPSLPATRARNVLLARTCLTTHGT